MLIDSEFHAGPQHVGNDLGDPTWPKCNYADLKRGTYDDVRVTVEVSCEQVRLY